MKKVFLLMIAGCAVIIARAQSSDLLPAWSVELNVSAGSMQPTVKTINFASAYPSEVNANIGNLSAASGSSMGGNLQVGYFVGKKHHFGISTGVMYSQQMYSLGMDKFHVEYQSTDYLGQTFRQLLTADAPIKENITATNVNIPVFLKYQVHLIGKLGLMIDAGALINVQITNAYSSNASFDYEAIYSYEQVNGKQVTVYDNASTPNQSDWLITQKNYGDNKGYINTLRAQGYNVGLDVQPGYAKGNVSYETGSIGFMAQPSFTYNIGRNLFLNLGFYYMMQTFMNNASSGYMTTNYIGEYNSFLNGVKNSAQTSYGGTLGLRLFFGKPKNKIMTPPPDMSGAN